jgi:hypothetical protein
MANANAGGRAMGLALGLGAAAGLRGTMHAGEGGVAFGRGMGAAGWDAAKGAGKLVRGAAGALGQPGDEATRVANHNPAMTRMAENKLSSKPVGNSPTNRPKV